MTNNSSARQLIRRVSARELFRPAKISDFIHPIDDLPRESKVVLVCRVSSIEQDHSENLADQERNLRREAAARGLKVVGCQSYVYDGRTPWIYPAVMLAEEHGATALLAETVDRFKRPDGYHSIHNPNALLTVWDLRPLTYKLGVALYTLSHPDSTPGQNRSAQTRRGQGAKDNRGGRPIKHRDRFREKWLPLARQLRDLNWSVRRIASEVSRKAGSGISFVSVAKWLKRVQIV